MNMPAGRLAVVAAMALLIPASLAAQNHQMGQMRMAPGGAMMQGNDMAMMQAMPMRPGPQMLLAQREALALSDAQVERLEGLENRLQTAVATHRDEMGTLRDQITGLRESEELDIGRYEKLLEQAADGHTALQVERARIGQEAFELLDDQQRSNVRYGMRMQRMMQPGAGMRSGQRMSGMMGDSMMNGSMDRTRMMAMMQQMRQHMQQMSEDCPAMSGSGGG